MFTIKSILLTALVIGTGSVLIIGHVKDTDNHYFLGSAQLKNRTLKTLKGCGSTNVEGVTVTGSTSINGPLTSKGSTFNTVSVKGSTEFSGDTVESTSSFVGSLDASNTTFKKAVSAMGSATLTNSFVKDSFQSTGSLTASHTEFADIQSTRKSSLQLTNCTIGSIEVKVNSEDVSKPAEPIELDGTTVKGSITFEHKDGVVILKNNAKVLGKIVGGTAKTIK